MDRAINATLSEGEDYSGHYNVRRGEEEPSEQKARLLYISLLSVRLSPSREEMITVRRSERGRDPPHSGKLPRLTHQHKRDAEGWEPIRR